MRKLKKKNDSISFLCIGKKGGDLLSKNHDVILTKNEIYDDLSLENVKEIADIYFEHKNINLICDPWIEGGVFNNG